MFKSISQKQIKMIDSNVYFLQMYLLKKANKKNNKKKIKKEKIICLEEIKCCISITKMEKLTIHL